MEPATTEDLLLEIARICESIAMPLGLKLQDLALPGGSLSPQFKTQKEAIYWHKKGARSLIEIDMMDILVRMMSSNGPQRASMAHIFREVLSAVNPTGTVSLVPADSTADYINRLAGTEAFKGPYQKPLSLSLLEEYDATNRTDFSNAERALLMRVARALASMDAPLSLKTRADLEVLQKALQPLPNPQAIGAGDNVPAGKPQTAGTQTKYSGPSMEALIAELQGLVGLKNVAPKGSNRRTLHCTWSSTVIPALAKRLSHDCCHGFTKLLGS